MNEGKRFEADFQKSVPEEHIIYRLPDSAQSFGRSNQLRFSRKNPFDYLLFDTKHRMLCAFELKTVNKKSISFERTKEDICDIHLHQIDGLNHWNQYAYTVCGFIIEFRSIDKCIFIDIDSFLNIIALTDKKSFTIEDLITNRIDFTFLSRRKKKTRYIYDVVSLLDQICNTNSEGNNNED